MIFPGEGWRMREAAESLTYGIRKDKYMPVPIPDVSTLCQLESVNLTNVRLLRAGELPTAMSVLCEQGCTIRSFIC